MNSVNTTRLDLNKLMIERNQQGSDKTKAFSKDEFKQLFEARLESKKTSDKEDSEKSQTSLNTDTTRVKLNDEQQAENYATPHKLTNKQKALKALSQLNSQSVDLVTLNNLYSAFKSVAY
ncbi:MAG: hypothetical protein HRT47_10890 [Candidatus Caenarcaniphilales bacterium]|nr:hypothetical protein [Candidatus Caenarcaniphilales bacterium]